MADYIDYHSKRTGEQVEALLDIVAQGGTGGGGEGTQGPQGEKGEDGVGIESVVQTTTSTADGGSNVVTVTLSNGSTSTFTVKNGSKGSSGTNGTNGTNGKDGTNGVDGATFTPSVDVNGNLSWTNDKGLTNPPTVNIKGPKGDSGEGGGSSTGGGKELVHIGDGVIEELLPNKIYILETGERELVFEIQSIAFPEYDDMYDGQYAEYTVIIAAEGMLGSLGGDSPTIWLPEEVYWANGVIPDMTEQAYYELSIVFFSGANSGGFNAVLTPFKPA